MTDDEKYQAWTHCDQLTLLISRTSLGGCTGHVARAMHDAAKANVRAPAIAKLFGQLGSAFAACVPSADSRAEVQRSADWGACLGDLLRFVLAAIMFLGSARAVAGFIRRDYHDVTGEMGTCYWAIADALDAYADEPYAYLASTSSGA